MCELYGIISNKPISLNESLKLFYKHSAQNPKGWGLSYWNDKSEITIYNEGKSANDSDLLKDILSHPIESKVSIGHIRTATVGLMSDKNSHPFTTNDCTGRGWTLAHNGNIYTGSQLLPFRDNQLGETDSECILLYIVDCINKKTQEKGNPLNSKERCEVIDSITKDLSQGNKLTLLIYDTEQFYAYTNIQELLYISSQEDYYCFVSVPLENSFFWNKVPLNILIVYSGNEQIYHGQDHGNEFLKTTPMKFHNFTL